MDDMEDRTSRHESERARSSSSSCSQESVESENKVNDDFERKDYKRLEWTDSERSTASDEEGVAELDEVAVGASNGVSTV
jgi:hypothetical protein